MNLTFINFGFQCDNAEAWIRSVERYAQEMGKDIGTAFVTQSRLLAQELIELTPPFGGQKLKAMLAVDGRKLTPKVEQEIENLSAKAVGERRVELDIRRVLFGMRGARMPARFRKRAQVILGQQKPKAGQQAIEFGVLQRCQGREAVRIYATAAGEVYGVDTARFMPSASMAELGAAHERHRISRGRVTMAGSSQELTVGRWRWLDVIVTSERRLKEYIKLKKHAVGQAKGGWARALKDLGGRVSERGWYGRHMNAGDCQIENGPYTTEITMTNHSRWASGGDEHRIVERALAYRTENTIRHLENRIEEAWKEAE